MVIDKRFFQEKQLELIILAYILIFFLLGISMQSFTELKEGLHQIFTASGILTTDYIEIGGLGPTFVNASIVALIGYILLIINEVKFNGLSITALFCLLGFALMGKTIWSVLPIMFGVYLYSKLTGREFVTNIYPALFGTGLAPMVTHTAFGFNLGVPAGIAVGIVIGLLISPIARQTLLFHEGYNIYNFGFATGIVGLVIMNYFRAYGFDVESNLVWGAQHHEYLRNFSIFLFLSMIIIGMLLTKDNLKNYLKVIKEPGVSVTDYISIAGTGSTLINMGLVGLIGVAYILLVGGDFNGPSVNGLLSLAGFAAFGKNPKNVLPIMAGVWIGTLFSVYDAGAPGPLLSALFGTTLAPLAGKFGPIVGMLAGMTHLNVVSISGFFHGYTNLYNNGFSGGLVAGLFIAVIKGFKKE